VRVCTACARSTEETGRFCPECGAALAELALAQTAGAGSPSPATSAAQLVGTTIDGEFVIEAVLGGGAFGTVYRGRQLGLERPVAIKVPTMQIAADPVMARRFAREARSAARVQHPGVVAIYGVGELDDGRPYLAMQFVEGDPLDRILAAGPISSVRALRIARSIASALAETHAADVVHRDLKPSNIVWRVDRTGDDRITLVDFGIAVCKLGNADATRLTADGLIGTPHYMSPEQAQGEDVDARADLYALGCLLFELVTATTPFDGSGFEVLLAHVHRPAPAPSERVEGIPEVVDHLCEALLAKKPDQRPQHADEVVASIDAALAELEGRPSAPTLAAPRPRPRPPAVPPRAATTRRERPMPSHPRPPTRARGLVLGAIVLASGLAGAAIATLVVLANRPGGVSDAGGITGKDDGPDDPRVTRRRTVFQDNGEMIVQALVPDPLVAGLEARARLEIRNKLGQPIVADEIVLTISDAQGGVQGLTARPRGEVAGRYYFRHTFPTPGRYLVRVFPPSIDAAFELPFDVLKP
jgi:eukaryotic-like serine/threonine-protein kinase